MERQRFRAVASAQPQGGIRISLPFDPSVALDDQDAYHVAGTIGGNRFRGALLQGSPWALKLGPSWCKHPGFGAGDEVEVLMDLEGPQSTTMGEDVAEAFCAEPDAARFFDSMPTFYRNNVARAIAGAKRPDTRAKHIAEAVDRARRGLREG